MVLGYLFCLLTAFLTLRAQPVNATTIFTDGIEDCAVGALAGQCGWNASNTSAVATTTEFYSGVKSGYLDTANTGKTYKIGGSVATGTISFWIKIGATAGANTGNYTIKLSDPLDPDSSNASAFLSVDCDGSNCTMWSARVRYYDGSFHDLCYPDLPPPATTTAWINANIEWNGATHKVKYQCGDGAWTGWVNPSFYSFSTLDKMRIETYGTAGLKVYFDNIAETSAPIVPPPPPAGYHPIITPVWPVDCTFNSTTSFSGTATGNISIPTEDPVIWTKLELHAWNADTGFQSIASTTAGFPLGAGEDLDYSIPYNFATGTYSSIFYAVRGTNCQGFNCTAGEIYIYECVFSGYGTWAEPTAPEIVAGPPEPLTTEDCSGYDLLERITCDIKNFIAGIFIPNASSTLELQRNLDLVKQRAPYNYISATTNFISSVATGLSTTTPEMSIMGATGTLDFSVLDATTTFAGSSQSFANMLRVFFNYVLVLGFIAWAVGYLRRIFK